MIDCNIIATGSKGNAVVVNNCIMIDCGVSFLTLKEVYKDLKIVLLTHEHGDHLNQKTISRLAKERPTLRFGCCEWLVETLLTMGISKKNIDAYEIGKTYDYKVFKLSPIKLYHDVSNCGYRLFLEGEKVIYATDTAHLEGITAKDYDLYMIEANYSEDEIRERIRMKQENGQYIHEYRAVNTHLSKEQADEFIYSNIGRNGQYLYLHQHEVKT